jgi:hypothetical protein
VLRQALPALEAAAGGDVIASVTVFHDPMDAIEHTLQAEPVDEILLAVTPRGWAVRLHLTSHIDYATWDCRSRSSTIRRGELVTATDTQ